MADMVCNCNTYYNIDYGVPILYYMPDYRTSTEFGLKFIPPQEQKFYNVKYPLPFNGNSSLLEYEKEIYKTDYLRQFDRKQYKWSPFTKPEVPLARNLHYMRTLKEKMYKNPPAPRKFTTEEYKEEYYPKKVERPESVMQNVEAQTTCQISSIGRGEQPRIKIEDKGIMKQLDNYVTMTQMTYIPFTRDQLHKSKQKPLTFYNAKDSAELKGINIRKPINDEIIFKNDIKSLIVPKLVYRIPFSGKTSEYKGSFKCPTTNCFASRTFSNDVTFGDSLSGPSKWQTLTAPNMFCTDYCHIGTGRSVETAVKLKDVKKYNHDYCK